jgi:hypothetical protein
MRYEHEEGRAPLHLWLLNSALLTHPVAGETTPSPEEDGGWRYQTGIRHTDPPVEMT